jgi:serine phosphatase RsbU (regulator of sigma subunit)
VQEPADIPALLARERALRRRAERLVEAANVLAGATRSGDVVQTLAHTAVPELADWSLVHVPAAGGTIELAAHAHGDPARAPLAARHERRHPTRASAARGPAAVLRTGNREVYRSVPPGLLAAMADDGDHRRRLEAIGMTSALILPLRSRGAVLGALTLVHAESGRSYDDDTVQAAEVLAGLAALTLDNARLQEETRHVARTLQRSLLPALPEVDGLDVAARYRAAGRANGVGGDFYDCFATGDDEWAILIGDVAGKGPEAAALTALVRHSAQVAAMRSSGPAEDLAIVNEALQRPAAAGRFCSAIGGRVRRAEDGRVVVRLASAGHPEPLLVRCDGRTDQVAVRGTLLGVLDVLDLAEAEVVLSAGDALVLFTDGATEIPGLTFADSQASLSAALARAGCRTAAELAEAVEHHAIVRTGGELRDDLAVLVVRAPDR